ncbi:hypothetical protein I6E29_01845 [Arcanobacterium haemolyticum]|nr:hypothetical protein [Arcanobacterium haemolyticum]
MTPENNRLTRIGIIMALSAALLGGIGQAVSSLYPDDNASVAVLFAPMIALLACGSYSIIRAVRGGSQWRSTYRQAARIFQVGAVLSVFVSVVVIVLAIPKGLAIATLLLGVVGLEGVVVLLGSARYLHKRSGMN